MLIRIKRRRFLKIWMNDTWKKAYMKNKVINYGFGAFLSVATKAVGIKAFSCQSLPLLIAN